MKIVILATNGISTNIVYNKLADVFDIEKIVIEDNVSKKTFIKRRIKRYGLINVMGQIAFSVLVVPILNFTSSNRKKAIMDQFELDDNDSYLSSDICIKVSSVNSPECKAILESAAPDIVVVNGTRIISSEILNCTNAVFINMHAGITPKYRGCHGAYWAYVNHDSMHAGTTIHIVDEGIDTGNVIYQKVITKTEQDNFVTYPLLQVAEGIALEIQAIRDYVQGKLETHNVDLPSNLCVHPTIWEYIYYRLRYNVK